MHSYTISDYLYEVKKDALSFISTDDGTFEEAFDKAYRSAAVTGLETYGLLSFGRACDTTAQLVWSPRFKEDFKTTMGRQISMDSPITFDMEVRCYCMKLLKEELRAEYSYMCFCDEFDIEP